MFPSVGRGRLRTGGTWFGGRLLSPLVPCRPTLLASGLLLGGPGVVGLGGVGLGGGGIWRGGCGGPPRSSRLRCGVGVGCGGAGVCCPRPRLWPMRGPPRPPRNTLPVGPGECR